MHPEGQLTIRVGVEQGVVARLAIDSSRRTDASRLLEGRSAQEVLERVPLLFSVCAQSQSVAARLACDGALRYGASGSQYQLLNALVRLETAHEYLWRLLLDLPKQVGQEPWVAPFAKLRALLQETIKQLCQDPAWKTLGRSVACCDTQALQVLMQPLELLGIELLGRPFQALVAIEDEAEFERWLGEAEAPLAQWLATLDATGPQVSLLPASLSEDNLRGLARCLAEEAAFVSRPHWQGEVVETGALARQQHRPLLRALSGRDGAGLRVRWWARLLDLGATLNELSRLAQGEGFAPCCGGLAIDDNSGLGWVETARGLLLHRVELRDGEVCGYRIAAPTEWNFHPQGAQYRALIGAEVADEASLRGRLDALCLALDPCVAYELEVNYA